MPDFLLRQILLLLEPLGLIWLSLIALTVALWRKRQRSLATGAAALALAIFLVGGTLLPALLLGTLEKPYAGLQPAHLPRADAIVVLGGGATASRLETGRIHLTKAADRLMMSLELLRLGKASVLVLGGGAAVLDGEMLLESELVRDRILALTFSSAGAPSLLTLGFSRNTHDEALHVQALVAARGWDRVLLVTSAFHMRRAAALFRTAGINVEPMACNFLGMERRDASWSRFHVPNWQGFELFSLWLHEQIGWCDARRRGWIHP